MSRTVIVRAPSRILDDPTTSVLYRYANGDTLVETDAVEVEGVRARDAAVPVQAGVAVDAPEHLDDARASLESLGDDAPITAYVELRGPADADLLAAIRAQGVEPRQFRPLHTYLSTGTVAAFRAVRDLPFVGAVTPVVEELKPRARTSEDATDTVDVDIVSAGGITSADALAADVTALDGVTVEGPAEETPTLIRIPARVTAAGQVAVLAIPGVIAVEPRAPRRAEDEVASLILVGSCDVSGRPQGSYTSWLDDNALNGAGVTIGIVDQGVDGSHPAFTGRFTDLADGAKDWHGTFVAGHAAGCYLEDKDADGFVYCIGMAPAAELLAQDNQRDATALCAETVASAGPSGVRGSIQNNSWGAGTHDPMDYRSQEASYDALVRNSATADDPAPLTICFSAGNDGTAGLTRPKAAKNLIITGNSENYRPAVGGTDADNASDVYTGAHASSRGNCGDGRIRPTVVAPGEWTASANYDSHPGEREYVSDRTTWGGGSSAASPKTAGACALLMQWWRNHDGGASPSPAMLRALIVNGADPISTGGPIPNPIQGWGRLNVDTIVRDDAHRTYVDQSILLTSRGDERTWTIRPSDPTKPLWITLAWTDPPGAPGTGTATAPAIVNRLALRARSDSRLYRANQFEGGWSAPDAGEAAEGNDNTQCIHLRPEDLGDTVEVSVTALELAMDCLTNTAGAPQQDFALVIRGGFVDRGMTPADVFLVVDDGAGSPAGGGGDDDHWAPGSSDDAELGENVGGSAPGGDEPADGGADGTSDDEPFDDGGDATSKDPPPETGPADDPGQSADDWWWDDGDSSAPEATRERPAVPPAVRAGAAAGVSVARGADNTAPPTGAANPVADLGAALARIDAAWATHDDTRRRTAVVVVGDATRVSNSDVAALRRLAFRGELWVLSTTSSILGFLSQRVHRCTRVHYRLFAGAAELARGVRNALAEAAGLDQLTTRTAPQPARGAIVAFDVVPDDASLVICIEGLPAGARGITLQRGAGNTPVRIEPGAPPAGVEVVPGDRVLELRTSVTEASAGVWTLAVPVGEGGRTPAVDVFARSRLALAASVTPTGDGPLVAVRGGSDTGLSRLRFGAPRIGGRAVAAEDGRGIDVVASDGRISAGEARSESGRDALTPSLGAVVRAPAGGAGARFVDLRGEVEGTLASGHRYTRVVRSGFVELEARSHWRDRLVAPRVVVTSGSVQDVARDGDGVGALTLRRGDKTRRVVVRDPRLRKHLTKIDLDADGLLFRVGGDVLLGVIKTMNTATTTVSHPEENGHGLISLAGLEPDVPMSEDARDSDYSGASRFVAAKYFLAKPQGRQINRVVIHITDGAGRIDGTIAWFKGPRKPDGTPLPVSAHYVVGQDGEVVQMVREKDVAYHANSANGDSIGIEHCARSPHALGGSDKGLPPTEVQYAASAALVRDICKRLGLPLDRQHVLGHNEADKTTTHTGCPTNAWDWNYYMGLLTAPAPSTPDGGSPANGADGGATGGDPSDVSSTTDEEPADDAGAAGAGTGADDTQTDGDGGWSDSTDDTTTDAPRTDDATTDDATDGDGGWSDSSGDATTDDTTTDATTTDDTPADDTTTDDPTTDDVGGWSDSTDDTTTDDTTTDDDGGWSDSTDDTRTDDTTTDDDGGWSDSTDDTTTDDTSSAPVVEMMRERFIAVDTPIARAPVYVSPRPVVAAIDVDVDRPIRRVFLRPRPIVLGAVPYTPTLPAPSLGDPIVVGDFVLWPDPPRAQALFTLATPRLRSATLVVKRAAVTAEGGGSTVKVVGADAVLTVSAFADADPAALEALGAGWSAELVARGFADAATWRFEPLTLSAITGAIALPDGDLAGEPTVAGAPDAGTVTFGVPLSETGALNWQQCLEDGLGSRIAGTCSLSAVYMARLGDTVDVRERPMASDLGTLLAGVGPAQVTVVDPQLTVATRVIVTAQELVDSVAVDLSPSEGAAATSLMFTKEGGQATLPVTSQHITDVTVPYNATVRFTPPGWPVIRQGGALSFADADWDLWLKPDTWVVAYDLFVTLLDDNNGVIAPDAAPAGDIVTMRLDYRHPALADPLSVTMQATSQQLVKVPFPDPPGSSAPATVDLTVVGMRGSNLAGPVSRTLTAEETMVVLKSYANGAVELRTNRDHVVESSLEADMLGVLAKLR
jgi:N-acetyl-anhydromuramyl-L-alanine amidase AmpD